MKIISAEFVTSAASPTQYPRQRLPEVAFAGRSNVGKSSLINTLVHRKNLVKTSGTPGKTRTLNFFVVNGRFSFVDFPGYGYARVPREMQASWRPMVEAYMKHQDMLRAVVHIIDFRHTPSELDWQLRAWLLNKQVTVLTVATKTDKVKRNQRAAHEREIRRGLALPDDEPLLLFSSHNHEGRLRLWQRLMPWLAPLGHT
jgi:GTP-binding protein